MSRFLVTVNQSMFMTLFNFYMSCYICYFGFKAILRLIIQFKLPKTSLYIPGILPIFYNIYEKYEINNKIIYKLIKKRLFTSKSKEIIKKTYRLESIEMEFLEKAIKYSKNYRFFYKWNAMIPLFKTNDDFVSVMLVLAEAYSRRISYTFTIKFNKKTKEVIKKEEGFISLDDWLNI